MNLTDQDRRTLLGRLLLVALTVRVVSMVGSDLGPAEAATALGLGINGPSVEWSARLMRG